MGSKSSLRNVSVIALLSSFRPFLLECPAQEVRFAFAKILAVTFESFIMHGGSAVKYA